MKTVFILLVLILNLPGTFAQIVNGGFENWNGTEPEGWKTSNTSSYTYITKSNDNHSGSYSLSNSVVDVFGFSLGGILFAGQNAEGFPISERYSNFSGYYKFIPADASDVINVIVIIANASGTDTTAIGSGSINLSQSNNFSQFNINIFYIDQSSQANVVKITIMLTNTSSFSAHVGSICYLDDFSLNYAVGVEKAPSPVFNYALLQNYPNPFNPTTSIKYSIKENTHVTLSVYDVLGREIKNLVNENKNPGEYEVKFDGSGMTSGIYFYRLKAGDFIKSKKMLILK